MGDRFRNIEKINKQLSMKYGFEKGLWFFLRVFLLYSLVFALFSLIIPKDALKFNLKNLKWIVTIIILSGYQVFIRYNWMKRRLDVALVVEKIESEDKYALIEIREQRLVSKSLVEISEKKLDIIKYFSTIPLLIYSLGLFVNLGKNSNELFDTNLINLTLAETMFYLSLIATIIYISYIIKFFKEYKDNKHDLTEYQKAEMRIMYEAKERVNV